jgi:uncharacterized protein (TIGR03067 family)
MAKTVLSASRDQFTPSARLRPVLPPVILFWSLVLMCEWLEIPQDEYGEEKENNMKQVGWVVLFLTVGFLGAAADNKAVREGLKKLDGTWNYTASELNGKKVPDDFINTSTLTIKGNTYTARLAGMVVDQGTITIDPTKKPMTIDRVSSKVKNFKMYGIYELDGDKLRICENGQKRPAKFDSKEGAFTSLHAFKRKK